MAAEKNNLVCLFKDEITGRISNSFVVADDVDNHRAGLRLQVNLFYAFADVGITGSDITGIDGALRQNLADLVESFLRETHLPEDAVGFVTDDIALCQDDAVGNVEHFQDAAEYLN